MAEAQTGTARSRPSWRMIVVVMVAAAVVGAVVGVVVVRVTSSGVAALTLEPADVAGADPFTDSVAAGGAVSALRRGDVAEWKRARAFLQSKIGHLR